MEEDIDSVPVSRVIVSADLREYFQRSIDAALDRQGVDAEVETTCYLVELLTAFQRAERLFDYNDNRLELRPLALLYADAVAERATEQRNRILRRLGDIALFVAGVFADSLERKLVDVDYYIAMGSSAYGYLSEPASGTSQRSYRDIYAELSRKFAAFVEVLSMVAERDDATRPDNVLRLYDAWRRSGSRRALQRLRALGIEPSWAPGVAQPRH